MTRPGHVLAIAALASSASVFTAMGATGVLLDYENRLFNWSGAGTVAVQPAAQAAEVPQPDPGLGDGDADDIYPRRSGGDGDADDISRKRTVRSPAGAVARNNQPRSTVRNDANQPRPSALDEPDDDNLPRHSGLDDGSGSGRGRGRGSSNSEDRSGRSDD